MMQFTLGDLSLTYQDGQLTGSPELIKLVRFAVTDGWLCSADYWGEITADLSSDWTAYLTISGALEQAYGVTPTVDAVPANPAGYEPEGPTEASEEPLSDFPAEDENPEYNWGPVHDEVQAMIAKYL